MKKPFNLLCLFDYGPGVHTGYATVSRNLVQLWKQYMYNAGYKEGEFNLTIIAINYNGDMYNEPDGTLVVSARKVAPPMFADDFGRMGFLKVLKEGNFDGVFILLDPGVISSGIKFMKEINEQKKKDNRPTFKTIFYFPIDSKPFKEAIKDIEYFDTLVTYNDYSRKEVIQVKPELKGRIKTMPHGINLDEFYPIENSDRYTFREEYFGSLADKFIILNLNRNQHRKDIPATIFAFQEFKKTHPDSVLYLHMDPEDPLGWRLRTLFWQTDLVEGIDFIFPPKGKTTADTATLNKIYNACDVYLTTTRGEGWGLSVTEAMATKLPVICPLNTSFHEITANGSRAYVMKDFYPVASRAECIIRDQCDYLEAAELLEQVHYNIRNNTPEHQKKINAAYEYAQTLSWGPIAKRWIEIFKETF